MIMESSTPIREEEEGEEGTNQHGHTILSVGKRYPGKAPPMAGHLCLKDTLKVLIRMECPSCKEIEQFRRMSAYGFYEGSDLPHGILIWQFGNSFIGETPFNPRLEETVRPDEVRAFLGGKANACQRILLDENATVRAIGLLGLNWELVGLLREKWGDPNLDWSDYDERYKKLITGTSIQEMWAKARKWTVGAHEIVGNASDPKENVSDAKPCCKCDVAHAAVARLKATLKQAECREEEQGRKVIEAQSQATALAKDKADLQAKIASLSPGLLQQKVAALNATIQERDFRILEMDEEAQNRDMIAKSQESKIDDLERQIKWLKTQLRKNGIPV